MASESLWIQRPGNIVAGIRAGGERGQAALMMTLMLFVLMMLGLFASNVGLIVFTQTSLQRAADAGALAWAMDITCSDACLSYNCPSGTNAPGSNTNDAHTWVTKNINADQVTTNCAPASGPHAGVSCPGQDCQYVEVIVKKDVPSLLSAFGGPVATVKARAVATPEQLHGPYPYVLMTFADNCAEFGIELAGASTINVVGKGGIYAHGCGGQDAIDVTDSGSKVLAPTTGSRIDVTGPVVNNGGYICTASTSPCSPATETTSISQLKDPMCPTGNLADSTCLQPPVVDTTQYTYTTTTVPTLNPTTLSVSNISNSCTTYQTPTTNALVPGCYAQIDTSTIGGPWTMSPVFPAAAPKTDNGTCPNIPVNSTLACTGSTTVTTIPGGTLVFTVTGGVPSQIVQITAAPNTLGTCPRTGALPGAAHSVSITYTCTSSEYAPAGSYSLTVKGTGAAGTPTVTAVDNANSPPASGPIPYVVQGGIKVSTNSLTMNSGAAFTVDVLGSGTCTGITTAVGICVSSGATFIMQPGTYNMASDTAVAGTLNMNAPSGGTYAMQSEITVASGGNLNLQPATYTFTKEGDVSVAGTLTMASGGAYTVQWGSLLLCGSGSAILEPGTYNIVSGGTGSAVPACGASTVSCGCIAVSGGTLTMATGTYSSFDIHGSGTCTGISTAVGICVGTGAEFDMQPGTYSVASNTTVAGTLYMQNASQTYLMQNDITVASTGTLKWDPGTYALAGTGSITDSGTFTLNPGGTYSVQMGALTVNSGVTVTLQGGQYLINGITVSGTLTMSPGTYQLEDSTGVTCGGVNSTICVASGGVWNMQPGQYNFHANDVQVYGQLTMGTNGSGCSSAAIGGGTFTCYSVYMSGLDANAGSVVKLAPGFYEPSISGIEVHAATASLSAGILILQGRVPTSNAVCTTSFLGVAESVPACGPYVIAAGANYGINVDGSATYAGGTLTSCETTATPCPKADGVMIYITCVGYSSTTTQPCNNNKVGGAGAPNMFSTSEHSTWTMLGDPEYGGLVYWVDRTMAEESHTILGGGTQTLGCAVSATPPSPAGFCPTTAGNTNAPAILYALSSEIQHGDSGSPACTACDTFNLYGQVVTFDLDLLAGQVYNVTFNSPFAPNFGSTLNGAKLSE